MFVREYHLNFSCFLAIDLALHAVCSGKLRGGVPHRARGAGGGVFDATPSFLGEYRLSSFQTTL